MSIPKGIELFLSLTKGREMAAKRNANYRSEQGKMVVGLTTVIRSRKSDLDHAPRWNVETLVRVNRPEKRVYKVTYTRIPEDNPAGGFEEHTEFLSTNQMSIAEMKELLEFVKAEPDQEVLKPRVSTKTLLTGVEKLEAQLKPADAPLTESVRSVAPSAPETRYRSVKVTKTYTTTHEETYVLRFTEKTLDEFKTMAQGNDEDKRVFNYLLRKQTERCDPTSSKTVEESDARFRIVD